MTTPDHDHLITAFTDRYHAPATRRLLRWLLRHDAPLASWSPATTAVWLTYRKAYAAWCQARGIAVPAPVGRRPAPAAAAPRGMTDADFAAWLTQARREPEPWRTYWLVVSDCGLRESEALGLRVGDVDWTPGQEGLRVRGKGGRERVVPLFPEMACWAGLRRLTRGRAATEPVFANRAGRAPAGAHARRRMARLCRRAGLVDAAGRPRYGVHSLRHTAAHRWLAQGVDLRTVQRLLGHRHLETTERYVAIDAQYVRQDLAAALRR